MDHSNTISMLAKEARSICIQLQEKNVESLALIIDLVEETQQCFGSINGMTYLLKSSQTFSMLTNFGIFCKGKKAKRCAELESKKEGDDRKSGAVAGRENDDKDDVEITAYSIPVDALSLTQTVQTEKGSFQEIKDICTKLKKNNAESLILLMDLGCNNSQCLSSDYGFSFVLNSKDGQNFWLEFILFCQEKNKLKGMLQNDISEIDGGRHDTLGNHTQHLESEIKTTSNQTQHIESEIKTTSSQTRSCHSCDQGSLVEEELLDESVISREDDLCRIQGNCNDDTENPSNDILCYVISYSDEEEGGSVGNCDIKIVHRSSNDRRGVNASRNKLNSDDDRNGIYIDTSEDYTDTSRDQINHDASRDYMNKDTNEDQMDHGSDEVDSVARTISRDHIVNDTNNEDMEICTALRNSPSSQDSSSSCQENMWRDKSCDGHGIPDSDLSSNTSEFATLHSSEISKGARDNVLEDEIKACTSPVGHETPSQSEDVHSNIDLDDVMWIEDSNEEWEVWVSGKDETSGIKIKHDEKSRSENETENNVICSNDISNKDMCANEISKKDAFLNEVSFSKMCSNESRNGDIGSNELPNADIKVAVKDVPSHVGTEDIENSKTSSETESNDMCSVEISSTMSDGCTQSSEHIEKESISFIDVEDLIKQNSSEDNRWQHGRKQRQISENSCLSEIISSPEMQKDSGYESYDMEDSQSKDLSSQLGQCMEVCSRNTKMGQGANDADFSISDSELESDIMQNMLSRMENSGTDLNLISERTNCDFDIDFDPSSHGVGDCIENMSTKQLGEVNGNDVAIDANAQQLEATQLIASKVVSQRNACEVDGVLPKRLQQSQRKQSKKRKNSKLAVKKKNKTSKNGIEYCLCRSTDISKFMIACDWCDEWYHGTCIGLSRKEAETIEKFFCDSCRVKTPSLQIIYKVGARSRMSPYGEMMASEQMEELPEDKKLTNTQKQGILPEDILDSGDSDFIVDVENVESDSPFSGISQQSATPTPLVAQHESSTHDMTKSSFTSPFHVHPSVFFHGYSKNPDKYICDPPLRGQDLDSYISVVKRSSTSQEEKKPRKDHNEKEKASRLLLRDLFQALGSLLGSTKKASKVSILKEATTTIKNLKSEELELEKKRSYEFRKRLENKKHLSNIELEIGCKAQIVGENIIEIIGGDKEWTEKARKRQDDQTLLQGSEGFKRKQSNLHTMVTSKIKDEDNIGDSVDHTIVPERVVQSAESAVNCDLIPVEMFHSKVDIVNLKIIPKEKVQSSVSTVDHIVIPDKVVDPTLSKHKFIPFELLHSEVKIANVKELPVEVVQSAISEVDCKQNPE